ncbi:MAG: hypothetical protein SGI72_02690, partial [Planctomycetota bacterium]|nr:hypothetical protein [Planctomycetota bacterium]
MRTSYSLALLFVGGVLTSLPGCRVVGTDYEPPTESVEKKWHADLASGLTAERADTAGWWRCFDDPVLDGLVARA